MKSNTLPSFWETYRKLDPDTRRRARKAYRLWVADSFHPSLRFKCINHEENIWSVLPITPDQFQEEDDQVRNRKRIKQGSGK